MRVVDLVITTGQAALLRAAGWSFDWSVEGDLIAGPSAVKALIIDDEIQGLVEYEILRSDLYVFLHKLEIHPLNRGTGRRHGDIAGILLAVVGRESFAAGCDGFVVFVSKTALYEYYQRKYGAKPLDGSRLHFDTQASENLIKTYLWGREIQYG
jgi:hypothetical protein